MDKFFQPAAPRQLSLGVICVIAALVGPPLATGCRKDVAADATVDGQRVKQSLADVMLQFAGVGRRFADLRKRLEPIPLATPGFAEARARFYAAEEARGVSEARIGVLSQRLDGAMRAGKRAELHAISREIASSHDDVRNIEQLYTKLLHEIMALQRIAGQPPGPTPASLSKNGQSGGRTTSQGPGITPKARGTGP